MIFIKYIPELFFHFNITQLAVLGNIGAKCLYHYQDRIALKHFKKKQFAFAMTYFCKRWL